VRCRLITAMIEHHNTCSCDFNSKGESANCLGSFRRAPETPACHHRTTVVDMYWPKVPRVSQVINTPRHARLNCFHAQLSRNWWDSRLLQGVSRSCHCTHMSHSGGYVTQHIMLMRLLMLLLLCTRVSEYVLYARVSAQRQDLKSEMVSRRFVGTS
jgi:hypothetical protein